MPSASEKEIKAKLAALQANITPLPEGWEQALGITPAPPPEVQKPNKTTTLEQKIQESKAALEEAHLKVEEEKAKKGKGVVISKGEPVVIKIANEVAEGLTKMTGIPSEVTIEKPAPTSDEVCFNKWFKQLITTAPPDIIGSNTAKDMILEILGTFPVCEESKK